MMLRSEMKEMNVNATGNTGASMTYEDYKTTKYLSVLFL